MGFFKLPMTGGITDILYFVLLGSSIYKYVGIRTTMNLGIVKICGIIVALFLLYYAYRVLSVPTYLSTIKILNLRAVYPIGFYFITIAYLDSEERIHKTIKALVIACIIGGVITIMQCLYGNTPMFDIDLFYNIGHWGGQMGMVGSIARVMLPVIYPIFILFMVIIFYSIIEEKTNYTWMLVFFMIPIFISFARGLWGATVISVFLGMVLLIWNNAISTSKVVKNIFGVIIVVIIALFILPYIAPDLGNSVSERFFLLFEDVENKSGTLEVRLEDSTEALLMWSEYIWTGVDPFLMDREEIPTLSDVGYTYVLTTIGLIGFLFVILIWITQFIQSIIMLRKSIALENNKMILYSITLFVSIVFWVISQQYTQYNFTLTLAFFIYGFAVAGYNLENQLELDSESEESSTDNDANSI